ncbi:hypothetical protein G7084_02295 [Weissella coleopterorum]|uniref:Regulatory protein YycH domain-containing protein n=1 Tax=Weissella coleopterorum TaxID=2714949 RepID=A0A6G8AZ43_9LACO|nr:two-component system activity regulator YycH [Weissella coleopterorum]QIL50257.1 hypothetical protein G7084_02295 [Weissella coleopterorum]
MRNSIRKLLSYIPERIRQDWRSIVLTVLVLTSLILTALVVQQVVTQNQGTSQSNNVSQNNLNINQQINYNVNQLVTIDADGKAELVMENRADINQLTQLVKKWQVGKPTIEKYNQRSFSEKIYAKNTMLLGYGNPVSKQVLWDTFGMQFQIKDTNGISWVQIAQDDHLKGINFIDTKHRTIYHFPQIQRDQALHQIKLSKKRIPIQLGYQHNNIEITRLAPTKLSQRSYVVAHEAADDIVERLFDGNNQNQHAQSNQQMIYTDGHQRRLVKKDVQKKYVYDYYPSLLKLNNFNQRIDYATKLIHGVYAGDDNLEYLQIKGEGHELYFQPYVDNLPVFNSQGLGAVTFKQYSKQHIKLTFSSDSLKVPLPIEDNQKVVLPAWTTVLQKLKKAGLASADITNWTIGYQWIVQDNDLALLKPAWFIQIKNGKWITVDKYLEGGAT